MYIYIYIIIVLCFSMIFRVRAMLLPLPRDNLAPVTLLAIVTLLQKAPAAATAASWPL